MDHCKILNILPHQYSLIFLFSGMMIRTCSHKPYGVTSLAFTFFVQIPGHTSQDGGRYHFDSFGRKVEALHSLQISPALHLVHLVLHRSVNWIPPQATQNLYEHCISRYPSVIPT